MVPASGTVCLCCLVEDLLAEQNTAPPKPDSARPWENAVGRIEISFRIHLRGAGVRKHRPRSLRQCMPVVPAVSQSTLPHAQVDGLGAEPSVVAQTGPLLHLLLFWDR